MLCQFSVKNYRSIKEEVTLDMQATAISEHKDHLLLDDDGEAFLPIAVIYGPNGGGKSNVLKALLDILYEIHTYECVTCIRSTDCVKRKKAVQINPFKFCEENLRTPTEFEIFFRTKKFEYKYNIHILNKEIVYESLYSKDLAKKSKYTKLFVRDVNVKGYFSIGTPFREMKFSHISKTFPLLSLYMMAYSDNSIVRDIMSWMLFGIGCFNYSTPDGNFIDTSVLEKEKILILKMLKHLDIDVENYEVIHKEKDELDIHTIHRVNEKTAKLDLFEEESSGTKKLFSIIPIAIKCLLEGMTLAIDELDANLHPRLLRFIIELFTDKQVNKKKAQLIFTSHELSTMDKDIFRRDEIWFAAKNAEQATSLYSLVEFKDKSTGKTPRNDANFNKQYLEGRYGADPYLKKIMDWEAVSVDE